MTKTLTKQDIDSFTANDIRYRHPSVRWVLLTEGAKHVAQAGEAIWLLNAIAFAQGDLPAVAAEPFQNWCLKVAADRSAVLTCAHYMDRMVLSLPIPFTEFPLTEITLWLIDNVILLPSEY